MFLQTFYRMWKLLEEVILDHNKFNYQIWDTLILKIMF